MSTPDLDASGQSGLGVFHRVGLTPQVSSNPNGGAASTFIEIGWAYNKKYVVPSHSLIYSYKSLYSPNTTTIYNQWCECLSPHPVHPSVNRPSQPSAASHTRGEGQKNAQKSPSPPCGRGGFRGWGVYGESNRLWIRSLWFAPLVIYRQYCGTNR